ncbi:DUF2270 domain-containing protein [Bradyrhizobium sp. CCGE-LA001]|uniref:DUF2270 domain-containing protein n=1 Tax=Bradyrhizobium sp. CCGE-LA001 TaxID=1223566 RepID=UPI001F16B139|nr:DUF2270 domain-containing protein [Bradyrhizobium sp. CCGE-LA001]
MGAIAHLYRGEVYRSTIWRTRLDNTTNWSIVTMGIALSTTFSSPEASPLPLVLVGLLLAVFLGMEARRYRYFNVWRARARWLEKNFYAPIFTGEAHDDSWKAILARDYTAPRHHISLVRAAGRRLRRNYVWILAIQATAYYGKIAIHPTPAVTLTELIDRAAVGPIPGWVILIMGFAYNSRGWRSRSARCGSTNASTASRATRSRWADDSGRLPVPWGSRGARSRPAAWRGLPSLTPPEFVIQHNYSDKDANDTGKRRDRCRGRLRAVEDRAGGPGSDRGSEPAGQAQCAQ